MGDKKKDKKARREDNQPKSGDKSQGEESGFSPSSLEASCPECGATSGCSHRPMGEQG